MRSRPAAERLRVGLTVAGPLLTAACTTLLGVRDVYLDKNDGGGDAGADVATFADVVDVADARIDTEDAADAPAESSDVTPDAPILDIPPSCRAGGDGQTSCGPASESCCTSIVVTGGTFHRHYTNSGGGPSNETDPATISTFRLDRYEVTVGRFRQFVTAWSGGYRPSIASGKHLHLNGGRGLADSSRLPDGGPQLAFEPGWDPGDDANVAPSDANLACDASAATWTSSPGSHEPLPINCVTWWEAYAFCIWDGGFLPSEAEWVYAASGGAQELPYPWGSAPPGQTSQFAIFGCGYGPSGDGGTCQGVVNIAPVGTAALGVGAVWPQFDLMGNVWEWNLDWSAPFKSPCVDCGYFSNPNAYRIAHGGDYMSNAASLVTSVRQEVIPATRSAQGGFRCARTP